MSILLTKEGTEFRVPSDILMFWSEYFSSALSGRWTIPTSFNYDEDGEISVGSLERIFGAFVVTGRYTIPNEEDLEKDCCGADYFGVTKLEALLHVRHRRG
jgi:hypothetical protein